MGEAIGRIEILLDPLALAHHVAEWMTKAALTAQALSVSPSPVDQRQRHFTDVSPRTNSGAVSLGSWCPGTGETNVSSLMTIPKAIFG